MFCSVVHKGSPEGRNTKTDGVTIIGAGPAGLTAAIVLRRHGIPVTIFEKSPDVGHRLSGDFQGLENWSSDTDITETLSTIGIKTDFLCVPWHDSVVYAQGMKPVKVSSERPLFYLVQRGSMKGTLDTGLKEQALQLGARIRFNATLQGILQQTIVASGPRRPDFIAAGIVFETTMENSAHVALDNRLAPGGYAYLLVHEGQGTLATVLYRNYRKNRECFESARRFFQAQAGVEIRNEKRFAGLGNFFLRDTQSGNGQLYVGEAAGFQDYLWGFGMRYSFVSGYLAARSIVDGSSYDDLWKREIGPLLEASVVNRFLFDKSGRTGHRYLACRLKRGDAGRFLRRLYSRSQFKQMLFPVVRNFAYNRQETEN